MRVLMINSVCGIRSTGRICTDLADALQQQGHEVKIAYGRECVPEKYSQYAVRIGSRFTPKIHAIQSRLWDFQGLGSRKATQDFIKWVIEYDPDVIHLHNIHGYYINIAVLFAYLRTCGKKIIWTLHDCWAFTGHCVYCHKDQCEKWKEGCSDCPSVSEYPKSFVDRSKRNWRIKKNLFTGLKNMTIVTPSEWLAEKVKQSFLGEYEVVVINNGINTEVFKPTESDIKKRFGIADKKVLLGVAAVWDERKGFRDFLELSQQITEEYRIVLIGLSEKQIRILPPNIIGIARTNDVSELAQWYSLAEVFINPTYEDNYPTTNLEAQACGTPCVTYRTGGSVESAIRYGKVVDKLVAREICNLDCRAMLRSDIEDLSIGRMIRDYLKLF